MIYIILAVVFAALAIAVQNGKANWLVLLNPLANKTGFNKNSFTRFVMNLLYILCGVMFVLFIFSLIPLLKFLLKIVVAIVIIAVISSAVYVNRSTRFYQ